MVAVPDSGFFTALLDRNDPAHDWAKSTLSRLSRPLVTCESALCETAFNLNAPRLVADLLASGEVDISFCAQHHAGRLAELLRKYDGMDWTDACIVVLSEVHRACQVVTVDARDFRIYRRFQNQPIPLMTP